MDEIKLGNTVRINPLAGASALVIGIWDDLYGARKYLCRYASNIGTICDYWLPDNELTLATKAQE